MSCSRITVLGLLTLFAITSNAEQLTIAVTSSFVRTAQELATIYEKSSGNAVRITSASTGKLYAQIEHGAPFDVLLAADEQRPRLLELSGSGVAGTRFTYAVGDLVLWSRDPTLANRDCVAHLHNLSERRLAIANPQTAPYGEAAMEYLQAAELWASVESHLVYGENIAQTLHFVVSGNASLGLIAGSQAMDARLPEPSCHWPVPGSMHKPLEHQAILLRRASGNEAASGFLVFLRADEARQVISAHGYRVPE
jgi:molybdate transport system substrate-binding protein